MKAHLHTAYISLGSNLGNRMHFLQQALDLIDGALGRVSAISAVYETPAWGFQGEPFLNACVALRTSLEPAALLAGLLETERRLGRERSGEQGYASRTLDLDLILYGDLVLKEEHLELPHPRLEQRRFVLQPMTDIAPKKIHPVSGLSMSELLWLCPDQSLITPVRETLIYPKPVFPEGSFIAIEGNIGAGKTTLATRISEQFNGKLVLEQFADNPFLPKFYEQPERFAFPLEMSFLAERYQQFTQDTTQPDLFRSLMVSDYDIFKSLIFARVTLNEEEFRLYRRLFNIMYKDVVKPDVYVYLHQNTDRLMENIRKRGRSYEQQIPGSYLESINKAYLDYIRTQPEQHTLVIDISDLDFVAHDDHYHQIVETIAASRNVS